MNRRIAAIRRGGLAVFACMALALLSTQAQAQACTGTPQVTIDPVGQTVPKSIPGAPTTVQLKGVTTKIGATFLWTQTLGPPVTLSPNRNVANPTFTAPSSGPTMVRFQLTVRCSTGNPGIATTDINVTDVVSNSPPTAAATASHTLAHEGNLVTLDGTASYDIDPGTTLTYSWAQTGVGPSSPGVTLSNANPAGSIVTFVAPNTPVATGAVLTFRLTVSDGSLTGNTDKTVNIVWTNDPPVATLACPAGGVFVVDEGASVTLDGSGSTDNDGSIVGYGWSQDVGLPNLGVAALGTPSISFNAPSLGYNQLGSLTLKLTVTDNVGAIDEAVCSVWINDVTAPAIAVPADQTLEADFAGGKAFSYDVMAFDAVDDQEPHALACTPSSGSAFPLAAAPANQKTTAVACTIADAAGNAASAGFNVTVQDTTAPLIDAPVSVAVEATGPDGAMVTFAASTSDAVDGNGLASCSPSSPGLFPLDDSTVTCTATDARNNQAAPAAIAIHVLDTQPPVISGVSADLVAEATSASGAGVSFSLPSADDVVDLQVPVSCNRASGDVFPIGETTVACSAGDTRGNASAASFKVTVADTRPPVIAEVADITVEASSSLGAVAAFAVPAALDAVDGAVTAVCSRLSGSTFALGATEVDCAASDTRGNTSHRTFVVTVGDTTPPAFAGGSPDLVAEAESATGAPVSFDLPLASDLVDGPVPVSCDRESGSVFGFTPTVVTCSTTDTRGNTDSTHFTVTVLDRTPPTISDVSDNLTVEATASTGAAVSYDPPVATDLVDGSVGVSCTPPSGSTFALGQATVACTATDARDNTAQAAFGVWVVDTTAPTLTPPSNVSTEATGPTTAVVHGGATASDAVGVLSLTSDAPAAFPLGTTTITWTATDAAGNSATAQSTVTVVDTTRPALLLPADFTREATSANGAAAGFTATASDLVDGNVATSCAPASGGTFALGATTVVCTASDLSQNAAQGSFVITVVDTTRPVLAWHPDVTATASANSGATVSYALPTATDLVDATVTVSCSPGSGSWFNVGTTAVTCTATDSHHNTATSTFDVIVGYGFNGFFRPIDNGVTNIVKAGSAIPVKFSLGGNQGLGIFAAGSPASFARSCSANQTDAIEETVAAGGSSLQYDAGADQYIYVWKTDKAWSGCRELQLKLKDGKVYRATFSFTR